MLIDLVHGCDSLTSVTAGPWAANASNDAVDVHIGMVNNPVGFVDIWLRNLFECASSIDRYLTYQRKDFGRSRPDRRG